MWAVNCYFFEIAITSVPTICFSDMCRERSPASKSAPRDDRPPEASFPVPGYQPGGNTCGIPTASVNPYLLFVGCLEPRKNLNTALDVWDLLPQALRRDPELVVAGSQLPR
jgi:hypothetical protein